MTDLETDKALALAIGWPEDRVNVVHGCVSITIFKSENWHSTRSFSHKDWNVIGPIAERYDCFPMKAIGGWYSSNWFEDKEVAQMYADTPQRAIAMAVIQGAKK